MPSILSKQSFGDTPTQPQFLKLIQIRSSVASWQCDTKDRAGRSPSVLPFRSIAYMSSGRRNWGSLLVTIRRSFLRSFMGLTCPNTFQRSSTRINCACSKSRFRTLLSGLLNSPRVRDGAVDSEKPPMLGGGGGQFTRTSTGTWQFPDQTNS